MGARARAVDNEAPVLFYSSVDRKVPFHYINRMNLTVEIPDDVAERLTAAGGDLSRRALEALAL